MIINYNPTFTSAAEKMANYDRLVELARQGSGTSREAHLLETMGCVTKEDADDAFRLGWAMRLIEQLARG